ARLVWAPPAARLPRAPLLLTPPLPPPCPRPAALFIAVDIVAMIALVVIAMAPGWCGSVARVLFHRWSWVERRAMDVLGTMSEGLRGVRAGHHFVPIVLSTALIWLLFALSVWTGLRAAHLDLPLAASWTVLAFLGLGVSLPSSPGYVGVVQAATIWALDIFKVPHTEALSFSLLLHASQFIPVTLYGIVLLLVEHVSLSDATRTTEASAA